MHTQVSGLTLAHSSKDPMLCEFWHTAENSRCGRAAPNALGAVGPLPATTTEQLGEWADRIQILDLTGAITDHDPISYLLDQLTFSTTRSALFDGGTFIEGTSFHRNSAA